METNTTQTWTQWNDARTEARLRELAIDLRHAVERGDLTDVEANAQYERTSTRWTTES